jgi:hypothetical protein
MSSKMFCAEVVPVGELDVCFTVKTISDGETVPAASKARVTRSAVTMGGSGYFGRH